MIIVNTEHKRVVLPYRADVEALVPGTQRFQHGGAWYVSVPHEVGAVRLMRNLNLDVPSPILNQYDWCGGTPFASQKATADMCSIARRAYVLSEMGVGKTRAVLWAYDFLRREGLANRLLVVAPLSTLTCVWENEIFENFNHLKTVVLYGDKRRRLKLLAEPADVYVINHDGVEVVAADLWERHDINTFIVDELAAYRNSKAVRWKNLERFVKRGEYVWGLTGSPTPNAPTDAYGQSKLLTPQLAGFSFKAFKDKTMRQVSAFRWVERPEAVSVVQGILQPAIRFTREQCFDLPPTTYTTREVGLTPQAAAAYKKMFDELAIQVKAKQVTAANEGVKLSKLLQISAGFIYDEKGQAHYIGGIERFRAVFEVVEAASGKVIVFAPFRYLVELLGAALAKRYSVAVIHGGVSKATRDAAFTDFQKTSSPRVLVAHPATMSHGLTLTAANTIVWASPITSLEVYEQANARITRAGQGQNTHIVHIVGSKVDAHVYKRLQKKSALQGALLDLIEEST